MGVVTSVNPLRITNASFERGQVCDYTRIGTFCAWAYLKKVDYGHNDAGDAPAESEGDTVFQA